MRVLRSRTVGAVAAIAAALLTTSACGGSGPSSSAGGDIKVGVITDRSGPTVANQLPWLHGFETAVKATNDAGGVNKRTIDVIVEDDKFDAALGLAAYKRLVNQEKVVALSGFGATDTQAAVAPLLEKDGVPIVGGQTIALEMVDPPHPEFFGVAPSYQLQADTIVGIAAKESGKARPKIAEIDSGITSGVQFKEFINANKDADVVGNFVLPANTTSADAVVQKIIAEKPDFIAFHGSASSLNATMKAQQKFGSAIPMLGVSATAAPSAWDGVDEKTGALYRFMQGVTPTPIEAPGTADLIKHAKAAGFENETVDPAFVSGYVSGLVLTQGLAKAGDDITKESVTKGIESLTSVDTGGLTGEMGYGVDDRAGMTVLRPYGWDYATKSFVPSGEYDDYAEFAK